MSTAAQNLLFARLTKFNEATGYFEAVAANETPDKAKEIFDYESSVPHFKAWSGEIEKATDGKSVGNVRAMHGKVAAGKLSAITFDDAAKSITVAGFAVDANERAKLATGVYTGVSIGGSYAKQWADPDNKALTRYTAIPAEISLVDNPCNPDARFTMVKADGATIEHEFTKAPEINVTEIESGATSEQVEALKTALAKTELTNGEVYALAKIHAPEFDETKTVAEIMPALLKAAGLTAPATPAERAAEELTKIAAAMAEPASRLLSKFASAALEKGLWTVATLAQKLDDLWYLCQSVRMEAEDEGDGSNVPARLRMCLTELGECLLDMTEEEVGERAVAANKTADVATLRKAAREEFAPLVKAGARHSAEDKKHLQAIHDHSSKLGADCATTAEKTAGGTLAKVAGESLCKALGLETADTDAMVKAIGILKGKAKQWDDAPAAPKGVVRAVSKDADSLTPLEKVTPGKDEPTRESQNTGDGERRGYAFSGREIVPAGN